MSKSYWLTLLLFVVSFSALASSGGADEHHPSVKDLFWPAVNFSLFFGFLLWKLRKPIKKMFDKHAGHIQEFFERAEEKDKEAQLKLEMYEKKLGNVKREVETIIDGSEDSAIAYAKREAGETEIRIERMHLDAKTRLESEKHLLQQKMNEELIEEVVAKTKEEIGSQEELKSKVATKLLAEI